MVVMVILGMISIILVGPLIQRVQDYMFLTKLKKTYSVLVHATRGMQSKNPVLSTYTANEYFDEITSIIKTVKKCESAQECWGTTSTYLTQYSFVDVNGVYYSIFKGYWAYTIGRAGISTTLYPEITVDWFISVDLNGPSKPNSAGIDRFSFVSTPAYGLLPSGSGTKTFGDGRGLWGLGDNAALVISSGKLHQ